MFKRISIFFFTLLLVISFISPALAGNLADAVDTTNDIAEDAGFNTDDDANINTLTGTIINAFLVLLGTIFLALLVYAGYIWMTAMGNTEKVEKSKNLISAAIIGLIITLASFAISHYVLDTFTKPTIDSEMR